MSIVKMRKMSLVAHNSERSKLLRIFIKNGCVEFIKTEKTDTDTTSQEKKIAELESKRFRMAFAIAFLKDTVKEINLSLEKDKKIAINLKKENRLIAYEEYLETAKNETSLLETISEMEGINKRLSDIHSEKTRLLGYIDQLSVYRNIAIPYGSIKDTAHTFSLLGIINTNSLEEVKSKLPPEAEIEYDMQDKMTAVLLVGHISKKEEILKVLSSAEFVRSNFHFMCSASEEIDRTLSKINELEKEHLLANDKVKEYLSVLPTLKIMYDYYTLEIDKAKVSLECAHTKKTIVMEGWVPFDREKKIGEEIEKTCQNVEIEFRDALDSENPPSLTKNKKIVSFFDGITDMFGAPNYRERDPKIFVAFYYFLIFGFMLGDAGYGLVVALACFIFTAIKKPVKNSGYMLIMFGFCGVSTLLWGALFGGWFGTLPSFMEKYHLFWFEPLKEPLTMFALSLGVGLIQIGTGFALHGIDTIKTGGIKNILLGVLKDFGWVVIIIGLFLFSPSLLSFLGIIGEVTGGIATLVTIGTYTALVGAGMMLASGIIGKKNPFKAVGGILGNAYGAINVVSDLLSYSRLFGLGLTSGVIGYVVNMLAYDVIVVTFFHGAWYAWILAIIVLVVGHAFNLAINLLGAYVHDSRLQYIEFFGRFYEGSGHAFKPLGSNSKYTYLDN